MFNFSDGRGHLNFDLFELPKILSRLQNDLPMYNTERPSMNRGAPSIALRRYGEKVLLYVYIKFFFNFGKDVKGCSK